MDEQRRGKRGGRRGRGRRRSRRARRSGPSGLLIVDKPTGLSSMDVVRRVRRAAGGVKTGHAGTLDPLATGVMICCLGQATKAVPALMDLRKCYEATVDLSAFTSTDDAEGEREEVTVATVPTDASLRAACDAFIGEVSQVPPAYSAVKVGGQRAYDAARQGETVSLSARSVRIDALDIITYDWPLVHLRITCGKGTYVRSLARDIGLALGTGGHITALRRTAVGDYSLSHAVPIERCEEPIDADALWPAPGETSASAAPGAATAPSPANQASHDHV